MNKTGIVESNLSISLKGIKPYGLSLGLHHESKVMNHTNVTYLKARIVVKATNRPCGNFLLQVVPLGDSYLVDPASSHMLVSKIKPCMSKFKQ